MVNFRKEMIKYLLNINGKTMTDVAKEANVSIAYINQIMSGKRPCSDKVLKIFVKFNIPENLVMGNPKSEVN